MKVADFGVAIELPENGLVASGMYDNSRRIILFCKLVQLVLGKGGGVIWPLVPYKITWMCYCFSNC